MDTEDTALHLILRLCQALACKLQQMKNNYCILHPQEIINYDIHFSSYDRPIRNYKPVIHFKISGFYHSLDEVFTFLGCYAVYVGSCLLAFQDSLLGSIFKGEAVQKKSLKIRLVGFPKTSVNNYQHKPCNSLAALTASHMCLYNCNQYKFKVHPQLLSNQPVTSHTPTLTYYCQSPLNKKIKYILIHKSSLNFMKMVSEY